MGKVFARHRVNLSQGAFIAIKEAIKKNKIIEGSNIRDFEELFALYIGTKYAISVSSARSGLMLVLKALGLKSGDEVILPAYTFHVVPAIIKSMNLKPVFVDVKIDTYNIDTSKIEAKITPRTKVILATHILGQPCEIDKIADLCKRHNIKIIEDCAHSCGAEYGGKKVGSFGEAGLFSFGMGKLITCFGGGIITCNDEYLKNKLLQMLKNHSNISKIQLTKTALKHTLFYLVTHSKIFPYSGYPAMRIADFFKNDIFDKTMEEPAELWKNFPDSFYRKFTNLQAMVGIEQLKTVDEKIAKTIKIAEIYNKELSGINNLAIPSLNQKAKHIYLYYRIRIKNRDRGEFRKRLLIKGIDSKTDDLSACPELKIFLGHSAGYPIAKEISITSLDIPCNHYLSEEDARIIATKVKEALNES